MNASGFIFTLKTKLFQIYTQHQAEKKFSPGFYKGHILFYSFVATLSYKCTL